MGSRTSKIQHVVILIQENRSFDNLFATFPGADGATTGLTHTGKSIPLVKSSLIAPCDFEHTFWGFALENARGKMDGFDTINCWNGKSFEPAGTKAYQYVDPAQIKPYWSMAKQWVLADHLFPTQGSGSFTAHLDLVRGSTAIGSDRSVVDGPTHQPWGCDSPAGTVTDLLKPSTTGYPSTGQILPNAGPFPCYHWNTIAERLDAKHISWKYYTPELCKSSCKTTGTLWNPFDAIYDVRYTSRWTTNISIPETNIFADLTAGTLPAVAWVVPDNTNSDHPDEPSDTGPSWVAQVVNAVGKSSYWDSTAILILWDDWGGFYDNELPPQLDYNGLGFRVPMIVVSPYASLGASGKPGYISHTQYEFGSILKFIEENWGLASLRTTDVRATSILDVFDFTQTPRKFVEIPRQVFQELLPAPSALISSGG